MKNGNQFISDYLAIVSGLAMCLMILLILLLDASMPAMAEKQYEDFPQIFRVMNYIVVLAGTAYLAILMTRRSLRLALHEWLFAAFLVCIAASTAINGLGEEAIHGISYRNIGVFHMAAFIIIYMGVSSRIYRTSFREHITLLYLAAADLVAIAALYDRYLGDIPAFAAKKELSAIFFNGNHYGYFLVMAILLGAGLMLFSGEGTRISDSSKRLPRKEGTRNASQPKDLFKSTKMALFGGTSAILNLIILAINHSMGCMLSVAVVLIASCLITVVTDPDRRIRAASVLGAMIVLFIIAIAASSEVRTELADFNKDIAAILAGNASGKTGHNRLRVWRLTAEYISKKPLFGYGCEGISMQMYSEIANSNPHNEVLTYAAYYGIPAATIYVAGVITAIFSHFNRKSPGAPACKASCMAAAGYFISSLTGVAMFYTLPFFFIFLGIAASREVY